MTIATPTLHLHLAVTDTEADALAAAWPPAAPAIAAARRAHLEARCGIERDPHRGIRQPAELYALTAIATLWWWNTLPPGPYELESRADEPLWIWHQ